MSSDAGLAFDLQLSDGTFKSDHWMCAPHEYQEDVDNKCCKKTKGYDICKEYADNNKAWLKDFTTAVYKSANTPVIIRRKVSKNTKDQETELF